MTPTCAIIPHTRVRHASSYYRCYEVANRSPLFEVYSGKGREVLIHQKSVHRDLFPYGRIHVLDLCDRVPIDSYAGFSHVTVTNETLARHYRKKTDVPVTVLPEVLPINKLYPYSDTSTNPYLSVCWFGLWHDHAPDFILSALRGVKDVQLTFMSHQEKVYKDRWAQRLFPRLKVPYKYVDWDWSNVRLTINTSDLVIIPTKLDEWWKYKSPNRLVLSVASGTPALCTATPEYKKLSPHTLPGPDSFPEALSLYRIRSQREELWNSQSEATQPLMPWNAIARWDSFVEKICASQPQT